MKKNWLHGHVFGIVFMWVKLIVCSKVRQSLKEEGKENKWSKKGRDCENMSLIDVWIIALESGVNRVEASVYDVKLVVREGICGN